MQSDKLQLNLINHITIRNVIDDSHFAQGQAGFLKNGHYAWAVHESTLEILSAETGVKIAQHNFGKNYGVRGCVITCVEEIEYMPGVCILAVITEFTSSGASAGMLSVFCVQGSKILGSMDFCDRITCCRYIDQAACQNSVLKMFQGTIAVGTDQGKLFLIDLMIPSNAHDISVSPSFDAEIFSCVNVLANVDQTQIALNHQRARSPDQQVSEKNFFSIQLEVLNDSSSILSILSMPSLYTMAVGLNDGRLVLYDLSDLEAFHLAYPPKTRAPLTHMSFLEPTDDPRCAVYIWAFHSSNEGGIAVMHSLMFATKIDLFYKDFKSCSVRLTLPMHSKDTIPICCRAITRSLTQDDEDVLTLNVLAWTSPGRKTTNIIIFDLNQWYKEEMPSVDDWRKKLKYIAVFELQNCAALDVIIHENSVFPFNSIMRPEEHFFPNSLSFDACVLENDKFSHYRWFGIQNIVLQQFNVIGPQIIIEPSYYFNELLQVAIVPQFTDVAYSISTSIEKKREFLMSVALEYNFNGFLKKCAFAWADGSFVGRDSSVGVGLSTLTDWIWNRVREIKDICNELCRPLFDYSEQRIDYGTQKQLSQCCKQLKVLSDLLSIVLRDYRRYIPDDIYDLLITQSETIKMASDYQEVLQWLLNVGLLPEGYYEPDQHNGLPEEFLIVPYPYKTIASHYKAQRMKLADEWTASDDTSKYLFIDSFIEEECNAEKLREIWKGVYPPRSMQALLRTLLVPDISIHNKHVIFVYLFMDITNVLSDGAYSSIVRNLIKFPAVFKMNPAMIKRSQAMWNLDNGHLDTAVEELISPLSHDKHLPLWQRELLIGALLKQNANSLALRALRCPGNPISSTLEMMTLLANNLMSEALKVQRASGDQELLEKLFEKILHSSNYEQLLDLSLTEDEGNVLRDYLQNLKDSGLPNHLNIHFVFLLQRAKFLDAAQLVESMGDESSMNMEPPKQVLNAYYATMESTTRRLTSMVYTDEVQLKDSPLPLSVNLIQAKCNAKNDIYQKCVQSITEAAYNTSTENQQMPFIGTPKLGIFEYRQSPMTHHDLSYSIDVNEHGKRKQIAKNEQIFHLDDFEKPQKKRRVEETKQKSFMDKPLSNLTVFKDTKPNYSFTKKNLSNSIRTTPERVYAFGNFLNTPIVEKKTPPQKVPERCPATPHSILKTKSLRGSVSPVPSRFSEFNDDNKSVKSITFAALPDSRDTSMNESFNDDPMESSAEAFLSPENSPEAKPLSATTSSQSFLEGPRARKSIKSRSTTPVEPTKNIVQEKEVVQDSEAAPVITKGEDKSKVDEPTGSDESADYGKPYYQDGVLKYTLNNDFSDDSSKSSTPDKSIYNYERKDVLAENYDEQLDSSSDDAKVVKSQDVESSEDSEMVADEHFEEEELPEHSEYDDSSEHENGDEYEYGNLDLNDSESSENQEPAKAAASEVICLDSSSDDDSFPAPLPSFHVLGSVPDDNQPTSSDFTEMISVPSSADELKIAQTQEEVFSVLYGDIQQQPDNDLVEEEIDSPMYEIVEPSNSQESPVEPESPLFEQYQFEIIESVNVQEVFVDANELPSEVEIPAQSSSDEPNKEVHLNEEDQVVVNEVEVETEELPKQISTEEPEQEVEEPTSSLPTATLIQADPKPVDDEGKNERENISEEIKEDKVESTTNIKVQVQQETRLNEFELAAQVDEEEIISSAKQAENDAELVETKESDHVNTSCYSESEDVSFVSASGVELNEALVMTNLSADQLEFDSARNSIDVVAAESTENQSEESKVLDQALITEETSMELLNEESNNSLNLARIDETLETTEKESVTPEDAEVMEISSRRKSRAKSVPSSTSSSPSSRTRASTEDRENPKNLLKGKMLERIEENVTPVPSPGPLTRRRSQLLEAGEKLDTPQTPTRMTRRKSLLLEDGSESSKLSRQTPTGTPTTPRRLTRKASRENLTKVESDATPEEPTQLKRTLSHRSSRKRAASESLYDNEDAKSSKSARSTRSTSKKSAPSSSTKVTPEKSSPGLSPGEEQETPSTSNRRLTRRQLQVIEKSRIVTEKISSTLRATKSEVITKKKKIVGDSESESAISDSESVNSSRASRKRKTPSLKKSSSVASKSSRRTPSPTTWQQLSVIPEVEESTVEASTREVTPSRTRRAKK